MKKLIVVLFLFGLYSCTNENIVKKNEVNSIIGKNNKYQINYDSLIDTKNYYKATDYSFVNQISMCVPKDWSMWKVFDEKTPIPPNGVALFDIHIKSNYTILDSVSYSNTRERYTPEMILHFYINTGSPPSVMSDQKMIYSTIFSGINFTETSEFYILESDLELKPSLLKDSMFIKLRKCIKQQIAIRNRKQGYIPNSRVEFPWN